MKFTLLIILLSLFIVPGDPVNIKKVRIDGDFRLPNTVAPLDYEDYLNRRTFATKYIPVRDTAFTEHERKAVTGAELEVVLPLFKEKAALVKDSEYARALVPRATAVATLRDTTWIGTEMGLYFAVNESGQVMRHEVYGIGGPAADHITAMATDSRGVLWAGTPAGLSRRDADGRWTTIRGRDGLPVEEITSMAIDHHDNLWLGTTQGAVLYKPYAKGRQWYYRAGKRYLVNDNIQEVMLGKDGMPVYFKTEDGISMLAAVRRTLAQKADIIEARLNKWHRRLGLVGACVFDDAENSTSHTIPDNDNDGLWTAYHVVAMSLAWAATGEERYKNSAREGMHALIMLQNASGIRGLVARSVLPIEFRSKKNARWRVTPDGKMIWKSDTSSDEIDGHFFAFYAYWEHIARHDPEEAALIKKQAGDIMNYIVDNNYQLIDWDGERTKWGFWNPEMLNDNPEHYLENGLNSAQILSFLKVSYYITGNKKFKTHYDKLITEHGYLANVLLEKKVFPDLDNHSDNQLAFCALYPLLQLEWDPRAREALHRAVRRHYFALNNERSAFFYFAAATIDPDYVDIKSAVENLRRIPTDRRQWKMTNSHRKDITWNSVNSRFGRPQLLHVLPADERNFDRWNRNPYYPDGGKGGQWEDDGGSWLLAYWMGRYHGFIAGPETKP